MSRPDSRSGQAGDNPHPAHGAGDGDLVRALERWRRTRPASAPEPSAAGRSASADDLTGLARRLDDSGCSYGRVSAARLEHLSRAYGRLETKLNAILMAVTGTFLSTLASLLLYYIRGGSH